MADTATNVTTTTSPDAAVVNPTNEKLKALGKNLAIHVAGLGIGIGIGHVVAKVTKAKKEKYMYYYLGSVLGVYAGYTGYNYYKNK